MEEIKYENSVFPANYQCPLCCEGKMDTCSEEPIELNVQSRVYSTKSFEEELMLLYKRANEQNDSSLSVVEEDPDSGEGDISDPEDLDVTGDANRNDSMNFITLDEELKPPVGKKQKQIQGKRRGRIAKHNRVTARSQGQVQTIGDVEESDTLIWIKADNEQSIPLVQCIHCSGWLPGYASCLQHSLTSHVDINESEERSFHCARCENVSMESPSLLITHFKEVHCPGHDFEVEENNGQLAVFDKSHPKIMPGVEKMKDIVYYCCICE